MASPTEQLVFELAEPQPPSFANFVAGPNREVVEALQRAATSAASEPGLLLWGAPGAGKGHLAQAAVMAARAAGRPAAWHADPDGVPDAAGEAGALVAIGAIDRAGEQAQGRLFTLYNALRELGGTLVATASVPPARMTIRDDLRTRLGWGLVYEVHPLADGDKPAALAGYARERGLRLDDDVIAWLLAHGRRDMKSLVATLEALDRHSLATRRAITIPLIKEWLQREIWRSGSAR